MNNDTSVIDQARDMCYNTVCAILKNQTVRYGVGAAACMLAAHEVKQHLRRKPSVTANNAHTCAHCCDKDIVKSVFAAFAPAFFDDDWSLIGALVSVMRDVHILQPHYAMIIDQSWRALRKWVDNINKNTTSNKQPEDVTGHAHSDTLSSKIASLLSLLVQGVAVYFGIKTTLMTKSGLRPWIDVVVKQFSSAGKSFSGVTTLFTAIIDCINWILPIAQNRVQRTSIIAQLDTEYPEFLDKWVAECQYLTRADITDTHAADISWARRVVVAAEIGDYIVKDLIASQSSKQNVAIFHLVRDIRSARDKMVRKALQFTIRPEPLLLWIYGEAGIGKSQMVADVIKEAIEELKHEGLIVVGNPTFTIQAGDKYMTGITPSTSVIILDDPRTNVSPETLASNIELIQRLISPAQFSPVMADLPDKGLSIAPELVVVTANTPDFGASCPQINDAGAMSRRIGLLVRAKSTIGQVSGVEGRTKLKAFHKKHNIDPTLSSVDRNAHLQFDISFTGKEDDMAHAKCDYQQLANVLRTTLIAHRNHQQMLYKTKLDALFALQTESVVDVSLREMFKEILDKGGKFFQPLQLPDSDKIGLVTDTLRDIYRVELDMTPVTESVSNVVELVQDMADDNAVETLRGAFDVQAHVEPVHVLTTHNAYNAFASMLPQLNYHLRCQHTPLLRGKFVVDKVNQVPCMYVPTPNGQRPISSKSVVEGLCPGGCIMADKHYWAEIQDSAPPLRVAQIRWIMQVYDLIYTVHPIKRAARRTTAAISSGIQKFVSQFWHDGVPTQLCVGVLALSLACGYRRWKSQNQRRSDALRISNDLLKELPMCQTHGKHGCTHRLCFPRSSVYWQPRAEQPNQNPEVASTSHLGEVEQCVKDRNLDAHIQYPTGRVAHRPGVKTQQRVLRRSLHKLSKATGQSVYQNVTPQFMTNFLFVTFEFEPSASGLVPPPRTIRGLIVCSHTVLALKHYFVDIGKFPIKNVKCVTSRDQSCTNVRWDDVERSDVGDEEFGSEIVVLKFPLTAFAPGRCLVKHFATENSVLEAMPSVATICTLQPEYSSVSLTTVGIQDFGGDYRVLGPDGRESSTINNVLTYRWGTPGDCMSVVLMNMAGSPKVVAFHVAGKGSGGIGVGEIVIRESLEDWDVCADHATVPTRDVDGQMVAQYRCMTGKDPERPIYQDLEEVIPATYRTFESYLDKPSVEYVGSLAREYQRPPAMKTKITESLIHGYVLPMTRPAPLKPEDVNRQFSPMYMGVSFHGHPPIGFPQFHLKTATNNLITYIKANARPLRNQVGPLSDYRAVAGFEGMDGYPSMALNTSEGLPYVWFRPPGAKDKNWLIEVEREQEVVYMHQGLQEVREHKLAQRSQGEPALTIFVDCLKDSRIPNEKYLKPGATRVFSAGPADFVIDIRKYLGDFFAAFQTTRPGMFHAIGINIYGPEWTSLAHYLQAGGAFTKFLCGDYSKFGPTLSADVLHETRVVVLAWYRMHWTGELEDFEVFERIVTCLFTEMINSMHVATGTVYITLCGSPSGTPITAPLNSLSNVFYVLVAWMALWTSRGIYEMTPLTQMLQHCRIVTYGDDIVIGVSDTIVDHFNNQYLQSFFASCGIKYTDAQKSTGEIRPFCEFADVDFLKCRFIPDPTTAGRYLAALSKTSIEDCANWIHASNDPQEQTLLAAEASLLLAYGHGPKYYAEHRDRLFRALQGLIDARAMRVFDWEYLHRQFSTGSVDFVVEDPSDLLTKPALLLQRLRAGAESVL